VWESRLHQVTHLPLLEQIEHTLTRPGFDGAPGAYASKPAGRIDCLAFLERIQAQSLRLATELGIPLMPLRARLARLSGAIGGTEDHQVRSWWATARVLTQHDGPPFSPDVPCPNEDCERWGSIRVRLDPKIAVCVECHTVWCDADGTYGRLAVWAGWAAEHLRGPRHWVPAYDPALGYRVECEECQPVRVGMAVREGERLRAVRAYQAPAEAVAS
jgi:hypothetical protein